MPVITFNGIERLRIEAYYEKIDEISALINARKENIFFIINNNSEIINTKKSAYITVEWVQRLDKEAIFANHLTNFFNKDVDKTVVFFTDVNKKIYINKEKIG